jgi:hypothetical protein
MLSDDIDANSQDNAFYLNVSGFSTNRVFSCVICQTGCFQQANKVSSGHYQFSRDACLSLVLDI